MFGKNLFFGICLMLFPFVVSEDKLGKCECAAMNSIPELLSATSPIITHNPMNFTCSPENAKICAQICMDLVKLATERTPAILCSIVLNSAGLKPSLYTRLCTDEWTYSGLTCNHTLCCNEGMKVECL